MSLQGTFNTSVQAMLSQSQMMQNISTNIANTNTTGYKLQDPHFATLLNHTTPSGTGRPKSFFTVNTFDYRQVDKQGTIATTNRTFDLAINGRGFIVTNTLMDGSGEFQYTRDGALFGKALDLGTDTDEDGQNDQGTLLTTAAGNFVFGWQADEAGNISESQDLKSLVPVTYSNNSVFPSKTTTEIKFQGNLSANATDRLNTSLPFVDQEGNSRSLTMGFTHSITGEWTLDMSAVNTANQPVDVIFDPPTLTFDGTGNLVTPTDGLINVEIGDSVGPQSLTIDIKKLSQFADGNKLSVENVDHDGYQEGRLLNTYFNSHGMLIGSYSNGELRNLFKLPIATFAADGNLEAKSGSTFIERPEAGAMKLNSLGSPTGTTHIVTGALEASNVDLADQFSKMIVTQRAYSSAAKCLSTADEMTQAARDLKR